MRTKYCPPTPHPRSIALVGAVTLLATVLSPLAPAFGAPRSVKPPLIRYAASTPAVEQLLEITRVGKKTISFKLTLGGSCQRTVTGLARLKDGDFEMDEDDDGVMFPAEEFVHKQKSGCELYLSIEFKKANRARVLQADDCKSACAPLEALMLRTDAAATAGGGRGRQAP